MTAKLAPEPKTFGGSKFTGWNHWVEYVDGVPHCHMGYYVNGQLQPDARWRDRCPVAHAPIAPRVHPESKNKHRVHE